MKKGEQEAKTILHNKGAVFDENYCDDNSQNSMPDLRLANGRFIEVTHTQHNNGIVMGLNDFQRKSVEDQMSIMSKARASYERIMSLDYPMHEGKITLEGRTALDEDVKIVKNHFGLDVSDLTRKTEFNCDLPIIEHSVDNIIRAISSKAQKYPNGDTDLFVFITDGEFECLYDLLETKARNGYSEHYMKRMLFSPFQVIYLCVWDFINQEYITKDPILYCFKKTVMNKIEYCKMLLIPPERPAPSPINRR